MSIRRRDPHIVRKAVKKKHKPYREYKENKRAKPTRPSLPYSELSERSKQSIRDNAAKYSLAATEGKTPRMRMARRRKRKEYLRIKYKLRNKTKVCTICLLDKALSDFDYQKKYRRAYCYLCRKKMNAEAYQRRKNDTARVH